MAKSVSSAKKDFDKKFGTSEANQQFFADLIERTTGGRISGASVRSLGVESTSPKKPEKTKGKKVDTARKIGVGKKGGLSERQELANARARRAGIAERNILAPETTEELIKAGQIRATTPEGRAEFAAEVAAEREALGLGETGVQAEFLGGGELDMRTLGQRTGDVMFLPSEMVQSITGKAIDVSNEEVEAMSNYFGIPEEEITKNLVKRETEKILDKTFEGGLRLVGDIDVFGLKSENIIDFFTSRKDIDKLDTTIDKIGTIAASIKGIRDAGGDSTAKSVARLQSLNTDLNILTEQINQAAIIDPTIKTSGEYLDILANIADQRTTIEDELSAVLETEPTFDPVLIKNYKDEFLKEVK